MGHCCVFSREYFEEVPHLAKARREWLLRRIVAAATYATTDRRSAVRSSVRTEERKRERGRNDATSAVGRLFSVRGERERGRECVRDESVKVRLSNFPVWMPVGKQTHKPRYPPPHEGLTDLKQVHNTQLTSKSRDVFVLQSHLRF